MLTFAQNFSFCVINTGIYTTICIESKRYLPY